MTREQEKKHIQDCFATIGEVTGRTVKGWFTRPPNTVHTRSLLAECGLVYDAGSVSDDIPYWDNVDGNPFLVVPYSLDVNDTKFFKGQFFTADDFARYAIDCFDVLFAEASKRRASATTSAATRKDQTCASPLDASSASSYAALAGARK